MNRARPVPGMPYTMELAVPEWLEKQMEQHVKPEARDYLAEAGRILRGETMMLPTLQHLEAVAFLVRQARSPAFDSPWDQRLQAEWMKQAEKVL